MRKFYDTSSLLNAPKDIFEENFIISSITLKELEEIKTSSSKDSLIKEKARQLLRIFNNQSQEKYQVVLYKDSFKELIQDIDYPNNNDSKILACALSLKEDLIFITNDLCLKYLAKPLFSRVDSIQEQKDNYTGYKEIQMSEDEMAYFYSYLNQNNYELLPNEYIIIRDKQNNLIDALRWNGLEFQRLKFGVFSSKWFGNVKPIKTDIYQQLLTDSLINNQITLVKGPAGSGKTFLSLSYLLYKLDHNQIDKIIIFCNTVATKDSARLGFYPGSRDEKLLDSQIGNLLASKLGDRCEVERLISEQKIILLPMSDIRGYDTSGMNAGVYISEAQNMSIDLMKLALQRIGEDSICIIDGDCETQVDDQAFSGSNNGMKRLSKIFRGHDIYGEITLKNIHRSKISQIAENM